MATARAKELMDHEASARIEAATTALAERFGVSPLPASDVGRDGEYNRIQARTRVASMLEAIVAAVSQKTAPVGPSGPAEVKGKRGPGHDSR